MHRPLHRTGVSEVRGVRSTYCFYRETTQSKLDSDFSWPFRGDPASPRPASRDPRFHTSNSCLLKVTDLPFLHPPSRLALAALLRQGGRPFRVLLAGAHYKTPALPFSPLMFPSGVASLQREGMDFGKVPTLRPIQATYCPSITGPILCSCPAPYMGHPTRFTRAVGGAKNGGRLFQPNGLPTTCRGPKNPITHRGRDVSSTTLRLLFQCKVRLFSGFFQPLSAVSYPMHRQFTSTDGDL